MTTGEISLTSSNYASIAGSFLSTGYTNGAYNNTSTIKGRVRLYRPDGLPNLKGIGEFTVRVYIEGDMVYNLNRYTKDVSIPAWPNVIDTWTFEDVVVPHRWDGSQSVRVSIHVVIYDIKGDGTVVATVEGNVDFNLDTISRFAWLTSAPDFTDLDNPTIYFNNPTGHSNSGLHAGIYDIDGIEAFAAYRQVDNPLGSSYTFNLTDAEREKLRVAASSHNGSLPVRFYLTTYQPGGANPTSLARTMTLSGDPPQLDIDLFDINEDAQSAIGNNTAILKGYNYVYYKINATPDDGATITKYTAKCGNKTLTTQEGYFENVESGDFTFTATDSRGRTKTETKSLTVIDYFKPTINQEVSLDLVGETSARAFVKISGTFYNANFGNKTNQIMVSIRHTDTNGEWIDWLNLEDLIVEVIKDGNTFSADLGITLPDYTKAYTFQCAVADTLGSYATTPEYPVKLIPVFDWSEEDFAFNVPVSIQGQPIADFVIEQDNDGSYAYRKWNSGRLEAWRVAQSTIEASATASYGSMYYADELTVSTTGEASQFTAVDNVQMTVNKNGAFGMWMPVVKKVEVSSGQAMITYSLLNPTNITAQVIPCVYIQGKWK